MNLSRIVDKDLLTYEQVAALLRADPATGVLWWLPASGRHGRAGGMVRCESGYVNVVLHGRSFKAHRLIWLLCTGSWPKYFIDHINGDRHDNRLANLRDVPHAENQRNQIYHRQGVKKGQQRRELRLAKNAAEVGALTFNVFDRELQKLGWTHGWKLGGV